MPPADAFANARRVIADHHPGIDETESIAYARGFIRGLIAAGKSRQEALMLTEYHKLADKTLSAGAAYMGLALAESAAQEVRQ